jgi:hypothetical protein
MPRTSRRQLRSILLTTAVVVATAAIAACSTHAPDAAPTPTASTSSCEVNPSSAPMQTAEPYRPVPAVGRISVALSGIPSGILTPGSTPTEVDITLCNDSAVDYPQVGVVLAFARCSCATSPIGLPEGTAARFDSATGGWTPLAHPVMGTGMDYLGAFTDVQALPKGKAMTLRYRVALDASMADGKGSLQAVAVTPTPLVQIGRADLPFAVSKQPATPERTPPSRQTVLPFIGLTFPGNPAIDGAGNVYVTDMDKRVVKQDPTSRPSCPSTTSAPWRRTPQATCTSSTTPTGRY